MPSPQIHGKTDNKLGLGLTECINKMGGPPKVIMTDGEGAIKISGLFHKYFTEHNITYIPSRGYPVFGKKDDEDLQGDVGQTEKTWPRVDRIDLPDTINIF